jgi:hypothetical protein
MSGNLRAAARPRLIRALRVGPTLVDPLTARMPQPLQVAGKQAWAHCDAATH